MILKSLEFKNAAGQKVKIIDIPVLEEGNPYYLMIQFRLQAFISKIFNTRSSRSCHSFREYLKRVMKWSDYEQLFKIEVLKHNA